MEDDDTEFSLRKRLMILDSNPDASIFTFKQSNAKDAHNRFTNFKDDVGQNNNSRDFSSDVDPQPRTNVESVDGSSDSELPCGLFNETLTENFEIENDPVTRTLISGTRHANLTINQNDTSTFTLKDLKAIEIDLTSDPTDINFTCLTSLGSPKKLPQTQHKISGTSPETHSEHVQYIGSESNSPVSDLPCEILTSKPLWERVQLTEERELEVISEVLPLPQTKVAASLNPKRGRPPLKPSPDKKRQAKLKADEKAKEKEERQRVRLEKRLEKEKAAQIRKAQQMSRKAFQPKECLKHLSVILDSALLSIPGLETAITGICENLGSTCLVQSQQIPFTLSWRRSVIESEVAAQGQTTLKEVDEDEIVVCLPLEHLVELVVGGKQKHRGESIADFQTLQGYIENVRQTYLGSLITLVVIGMENYFRKTKKSKTSKKSRTDTIISRVDVEEALVNLQLRNLCNCQLINSIEDMADIVRTFTKAVAEKPMKKDRLQSEFSFHNEKGGGIASDTPSLWKVQLEQFKNISSDISSAIVSQYPSPKSLIEAYKKCSTESDCIKLLENILVRRKAGVLETSRRVGKEASRRIYLLMTTTDGDLVLK